MISCQNANAVPGSRTATGSISYLGKGRRRPYAAYPPVTAYTEDGRVIRPKALGYAATYTEAMELLVGYHKGLTLPDVPIVPKRGPTFAEVYEGYCKDKFENTGKPLSVSSRYGASTAYKNAAVLHDRDFRALTYPDLQAVLDSCPLKHSSIELIKNLFRGMYKYAIKMEIVDKDPSQHLQIRIPDDDEHGVPFTPEEIALLWARKADITAQMILTMIYSGFRASAYRGISVHLEPDWYFQGGLKTAAGKDRVVPIHSAIRPFVEAVLLRDKVPLRMTDNTINKYIRRYLPTIGIQTDHTAHDCRHTFSALCERYGVPEADRKRLLGHSFGADITNGIYGHRTVEELRESIERIQVPE